MTTATAAGATGEEIDDDAADGDNAVNDGGEDASDAGDDSHDGVANSAEDAGDLRVCQYGSWRSRRSMRRKTYARDDGTHFE